MMKMTGRVVDENTSSKFKVTNSTKNTTKRASKRVFGTDLTNGQNLRTDDDWKMAVDEDSDCKDVDTQIMPEIISQPATWKWDEETEGDLNVTEYAEDIIHSLTEQEQSLGDFMRFQQDITPQMRAIVTNWIIDVHRNCKLKQSILFLTINIIDRYIAAKPIKSSSLQLLARTSLWMASKYHDIHALPKNHEFWDWLSDPKVCRTILAKMELDILKTLQFELTVPTTLNFVERYSQIAAYYCTTKRTKRSVVAMIMYCSKHCLMNYSLSQQKPSLLGAACFVYSCLAVRVLSRKKLEDENLEKVVGYTVDELAPAMRVLDAEIRATQSRCSGTIAVPVTAALHE